METIHDFVKVVDGIKEALIAVASTLSVGAICVRIIWEKFKPPPK